VARKKGAKGGSRPAAPRASERTRPAAETGGHGGPPHETSGGPPHETSAGPPQDLSAAWLAATLGLCAIGVLGGGYLTALHVDLFYGAGVADSLCDFGGAWSCSSVNGSEWSHVGPVPVALMAVPTYGLAGWLAWRTRLDGRGSEANALLFAVGVVAAAFSLFLAAISAFVLQAFCAVCVAMYVVSVAVPALAWAGSGLSLGDLVGRARPGATATRGAILFAASALIAGGAYAQMRSSALAEATAVALGEPTSDPGESLPDAPPPPAVPKGEIAGGEVKQVRIQAASAAIAAPKGAFSMGPEDAPVQALAFSDFQCPFCKRLAGSLHQLHEEYPDQVRVVFLQFPMDLACNAAPLKKSMHPEACAAAYAAICAGDQGKFVQAHDALFQEQGRLGEPLYASLPGRIGLDGGRYDACRRDPATRERVLTDTKLGAKAGIDGTPNLVLNGRVLAGAQPIEVLRAVVEAEIGKDAGQLDLDVKVGTERVGKVEGPGTVDLGSYRIDAFEASIAGGKAISEPGRTVSGGVTWYQANAACEATGKRLCSEKEFLRACMGSDPVDADKDGTYSNDPPTGRFYAYGGLYREGTCADARDPQNPGDIVSGTHPGCGTPEGVYDLHGNVKEWVGLDPSSAALMGGSYFSGESARCTYRREDVAPDTKDPSNGFRCCEGPADLPDPDRFAGGKTGDRLMDFTVDELDGTGKISTKDIVGKPTILTFWASWCGPCRQEMPILSKLAEQYRAQGLRVVAISIDDTPEAAKGFLAKNPMSFDIGFDPGGARVKSRFMAEAIPATFWVRADGVIRQRTVGVPNGGERRLEELAKELVAAE
jgi:protein-disulfide isomerase/uncharacterized membrane protein/peroxiredoxin